MRDYAFYNVGCSGHQGHRRAIVPLRRLIRRLLRPFFFRQAELFEQLGRDIDELAKRQDEFDRRLRTSLAFGWDYVALVRRLTTLEEYVEALRQASPGVVPGGATRMSIPFPLPEEDDIPPEDKGGQVDLNRAVEA